MDKNYHSGGPPTELPSDFGDFSDGQSFCGGGDYVPIAPLGNFVYAGTQEMPMDSLLYARKHLKSKLIRTLYGLCLCLAVVSIITSWLFWRYGNYWLNPVDVALGMAALCGIRATVSGKNGFSSYDVDSFIAIERQIRKNRKKKE